VQSARGCRPVAEQLRATRRMRIDDSARTPSPSFTVSTVNAYNAVGAQALGKKKRPAFPHREGAGRVAFSNFIDATSKSPRTSRMRQTFNDI
jgi:hypothetical protein